MRRKLSTGGNRIEINRKTTKQIFKNKTEEGGRAKNEREGQLYSFYEKERKLFIKKVLKICQENERGQKRKRRLIEENWGKQVARNRSYKER